MASNYDANVCILIDMFDKILDIMDVPYEIIVELFTKLGVATSEDRAKINAALDASTYDMSTTMTLMQIITSKSPTEIAMAALANMTSLTTINPATTDRPQSATAAAEQVESDRQMAEEMQKLLDEPNGGGAAAAAPTSYAAAAAAPAATATAATATTSAWGTRRTNISTNDSADMLDRMKASAKVNQANRNSKKTPVKTPEDKLKEVTTRISALCNENKSAGFSEKRQSKIDELKENQEKLNKQIAATQVPCGRG